MQQNVISTPPSRLSRSLSVISKPVSATALPITEKRKLVIMMHGWGADGADLSALAPHLTSHLEQWILLPRCPFPLFSKSFWS